ncbi:MAG TPA: DNA adenine methylase [Candidatus Gastranaerophilales bacterium]|nr:DNA adenine methylase [Candidatus Gastranaerophilales bacterium]
MQDYQNNYNNQGKKSKRKVPATHLINWVGGKRLLRKYLEPLVPDDIVSYIEVFGGGAWVLFYKDRWADLEIYNDFDSRLTNLFRVVKYHPQELRREMRFMLGSRELFEEFLYQEGLTDIQRAARFMYVITRSFGGKGSTFGTVKKSCGGASKSHQNLMDRAYAIHNRLDKVLIENRDFEKLIKQYDHESAFFYCDPPYTYGAGYSVTSTKDFEHERLRDCLKNIQGRFLLSYDDSEKVRELYKDYEMVEVERLNGINNRLGDERKNKMFKELIIANYPIREIFYERFHRNSA